MTSSDPRLVNRLTSAKDLPNFSGNPLEWMKFKQAYELSSELGEYDSRENVLRLDRALEGESRSAVENILATGSDDVDLIIETLEFRCGKKNIIFEAIVSGLRQLPDVTSSMDVLVFSTKLRSAVIAIHSLEDIGYLSSPDLVKELLRKLPSTMVTDYMKYLSKLENPTLNLQILSDFVHLEVKTYSTLGFVDLARPSTSQASKNHSNVKNSQNKNLSGVVCLTSAEEIDEQDHTTVAYTVGIEHCVRCDKDGHNIRDCRIFARDMPSKRWSIVNKARLCHACLKPGHMKKDCSGNNCKLCRSSNHHKLLHEMFYKNNNFNTRRNVISNTNDSGDKSEKSSQPLGNTPAL